MVNIREKKSLKRTACFFSLPHKDTRIQNVCVHLYTHTRLPSVFKHTLAERCARCVIFETFHKSLHNSQHWSVFRNTRAVWLRQSDWLTDPRLAKRKRLVMKVAAYLQCPYCLGPVHLTNLGDGCQQNTAGFVGVLLHRLQYVVDADLQR